MEMFIVLRSLINILFSQLRTELIVKAEVFPARKNEWKSWFLGFPRKALQWFWIETVNVTKTVNSELRGKLKEEKETWKWSKMLL